MSIYPNDIEQAHDIAKIKAKLDFIYELAVKDFSPEQLKETEKLLKRREIEHEISILKKMGLNDSAAQIQGLTQMYKNL